MKSILYKLVTEIIFRVQFTHIVLPAVTVSQNSEHR